MSLRVTSTQRAALVVLGIATAQCGTDPSFNLDCSPSNPSVGDRVSLTLDYEVDSVSTPFEWVDTIGLGAFEATSTIPAADAGTLSNGFTATSAGTTTIEVRRDMDVVASCVLQVTALPVFNVSVNVVGDGAVAFADEASCRTACQEEVTVDTEVTFVASPDPGWEFDGWSGACASSTSTAAVVTITEDVTCGATFVESSAPGPDELEVPAGTFQRGCIVDANADPDCPETATTVCSGSQTPSALITLSAFRIDRLEVTVAEYRACVTAGDCTPPSSFEGCNYFESNREQHPVNCVSWEQADAYCAAQGQRLPTEAEWEMAARGTEDARRFPWGDECPLCSRGNYFSTVEGRCTPAPGATLPVGSHPDGASPFGALDMAGNVFEWVADYYEADYYDQSPATDPLGPESGTQRVQRGGSFRTTSSTSRTFHRRPQDPTIASDENGFRCAR